MIRAHNAVIAPESDCRRTFRIYSRIRRTGIAQARGYTKGAEFDPTTENRLHRTPMSGKPFPTISIAVTVISAAVLATSSTIYTNHCTFGFGGFQCNSPFAGYADMLLIVTFVSLLVLIVSAAIATRKLIVWLRIP
ncbi:MAG: hypothetical protein LBE61_19175 [Burkholderiaceae bacterium]|nr:hypothetical protein [Burkholderiaceae bacterium]